VACGGGDLAGVLRRRGGAVWRVGEGRGAGVRSARRAGQRRQTGPVAGGRKEEGKEREERRGREKEKKKKEKGEKEKKRKEKWEKRGKEIEKSFRRLEKFVRKIGEGFCEVFPISRASA
jgi:hypothetical protein